MSNQNFKFTAKDFWKLLEEQEKVCPVSGASLTPMNTEIELRNHDLKGKERLSMKNHYLVDVRVSKLARHYNETEIIELAVEIIQNRGAEIGYGLRKLRKKD